MTEAEIEARARAVGMKHVFFFDDGPARMLHVVFDGKAYECAAAVGEEAPVYISAQLEAFIEERGLNR